MIVRSEKMKKWLKDHKISLFVVVVAIVMLIGLSYAWLQITLRGEKEINIFAAGSLRLVLDDTMTNGINITEAIPITDDEGKTLEEYTFTLENTGKVDSDYTIYLDDLELPTDKARMQDEFIKYYLVRDGKELALDLLSTTGTNPERIIDSGSIESGEKFTYSLRMWIDQDATNEVMDTVFKGNLRVEAMQKANSVSKPKMDDNMIAVVYDETQNSWTKIDPDDLTWYNYDEQKWANAVTVSSATRNTYLSADIGTPVNIDDIETMWVWIPRYSYTIGSEDGENYYGKQGEYLSSTPTRELPGEIDVKFVSRGTKDKGSAQYLVSKGVSGWRTPDAFTFGDKELSGIWVGKFETSSSNPMAEYGGGNTTDPDPMIKPNVTSWRSIQVANIASVGRKVSSSGNRYGFDSAKIDSHAMKNNEWAAAAYLSQSKYGKLGNHDFSEANKEIYQNKSNQYITGCSYGFPSRDYGDGGCEYTYDVMNYGTGSSTTGTIYGIYDMSGSAYEYVMADYAPDNVKYSGFSSKEYTKEEAALLGDSRGIDIGIWNSGYSGKTGFENLVFQGKEWLEDKYYNFYTTSDVNTACNRQVCYSHAMKDVSNWYDDQEGMIDAKRPWIIRGGFFYDNKIAGVFYFFTAQGNEYEDGSFRLVLSSN